MFEGNASKHKLFVFNEYALLRRHLKSYKSASFNFTRHFVRMSTPHLSVQNLVDPNLTEPLIIGTEASNSYSEILFDEEAKAVIDKDGLIANGVFIWDSMEQLLKQRITDSHRMSGKELTAGQESSSSLICGGCTFEFMGMAVGLIYWNPSHVVVALSNTDRRRLGRLVPVKHYQTQSNWICHLVDPNHPQLVCDLSLPNIIQEHEWLLMKSLNTECYYLLKLRANEATRANEASGNKGMQLKRLICSPDEMLNKSFSLSCVLPLLEPFDYSHALADLLKTIRNIKHSTDKDNTSQSVIQPDITISDPMKNYFRQLLENCKLSTAGNQISVRRQSFLPDL